MKRFVRRIASISLLFFLIIGVIFFVYGKHILFKPKTVRLSDSELHYTLWWMDEAYKDPEKVDDFITHIKENNGKYIFTSINWASIETQEGEYNFSEVDARLDRIAKAEIPFFVVLDASRPNNISSIPSYIWEKYPECQAKDFSGNTRQLISFGDEECVQRAFDFFTIATKHIQEKYGKFVIAEQPNFNTEYELKYSQFAYAWQDYSESTAADYRIWLQKRHPNSAYWAAKWGVQITDFSQITLPIISYNRDVDPDIERQFYDWQAYREQKIIDVYSRAAQAVKQAGGKVVYHFGEWGTANDAIYTTPIIPMLSSGDVDYAIIDSNLKDAKENKNDPVVGAVLAAYTKRFTIPVSFEVAAERLDMNQEQDRALVAQALENALQNNVSISVTNLYNPQDVQRIFALSQKEIYPTTTCKQAIYRSRWQYYAFHGATGFTTTDPTMQNTENDIDPWQKNLFDIYKEAAQKGCVEIWDDELMTDKNLKSIKTLYLQDAEILRSDVSKRIEKAEKNGLTVMRNSKTGRFILDSDYTLTQLLP